MSLRTIAIIILAGGLFLNGGWMLGAVMLVGAVVLHLADDNEQRAYNDVERRVSKKKADRWRRGATLERLPFMIFYAVVAYFLYARAMGWW